MNKDLKGFFKHAELDSKQTEMFGNVQLGGFHSDNYDEIRKEFDDMFSSFPFIDSYFFILHYDSDYLHVHFILLLKIQVRLNTVMNRISDYLHVDTRAISIDKLVSIVGALKYVLHMSSDSIDDGKHLYSEFELISNESPMIISGYLDSESPDNVAITLIRQLVIECSIKSDVLIRLRSDKLIRKNRYYIDTLWNDKSMLQLRQNEYDDNYS